MFGPHLEDQLGRRGYTLGHLPDSFTHSTLGGWIATRSSGMQSDRYGDIADLTKGLRAVTPSGTLIAQPVPAASTGPSVPQMVLGSEGRLGIITEATVQVRRRARPAHRSWATCSRTFFDGLAAMREIAESECSVSVTRVSDAHETQLLRSRRATAIRRSSTSSGPRALRLFLDATPGLRRQSDVRWRSSAMRAAPATSAAQRRAVGRLVKRHGGLCIGSGPGALYDQKKFDTPYIRDYLLDRGAAGDVSETAMPWSRLEPVYDAVSTARRTRAFVEVGVQGYLMCHLSHSYHVGRLPLLHVRVRAVAPGDDMLAAYDIVKSAIQQAFVDNGATLSHHHAVGTEHARWLEQDISAHRAWRCSTALFEGADPGRHLNPGKIV